MVTTNLLGPIRLTAALLPRLLQQRRSTIINVTSGLALVPGAGVPTYSATKAAMHAYTLAMRRQLRKTPVSVIEVIPPYVQTDLGPSHGADPRAMPLPAFIAEVMTILKESSDATEIIVERCKPVRFAAEGGQFNTVFHHLERSNVVGLFHLRACDDPPPEDLLAYVVSVESEYGTTPATERRHAAVSLLNVLFLRARNQRMSRPSVWSKRASAAHP